MSDRRSYSLESRRGCTTHTTLAGEKKPFAKRRVLTSRHSQVTMIGSTARPGVRRGDVSEEPRRWLLIAVLVAALMPTIWAGCTYSQFGPVCLVHGSQAPSINPSSTYDTIKIRGEGVVGGISEQLTIQTEAFKNIKARKIELYYLRNIIWQPRAFSGIGGELKAI